MSLALDRPFPVPRGLAVALAAAGPVALGGVLAARTGDPTPLAAVPAIVFGVVAATAPALYIAIAATGDAPPLARVARAFAIALGAFGLALAGLVLPAAFLSLSSLQPVTTAVVVSAALGGAALLGMRRLAAELETTTLTSLIVFGVWGTATLGIAGRLWYDLSGTVLS